MRALEGRCVSRDAAYDAFICGTNTVRVGPPDSDFYGCDCSPGVNLRKINKTKIEFGSC